MHEEIRKAIERGVNKGEPRLREQLDGLKGAVKKWAGDLIETGATPEEVYVLISDNLETMYEQGSYSRLTCNLVELYVDEWYEEQVEE